MVGGEDVSRVTEWMRPLGDRPAPPGIDISKASIARVYDYVLDGKDHFAVDRAAAEAFLRVVPQARRIAHDNRSALRRGVRYLVREAGIRQIIDIGSGLPTAGNVHEIAHEMDPTVRVIYVDKDPIVLAHGRALLADNATTTVITADLLEPDSIFDHPTVRNYIDDQEPFAVLACGILHHLNDDQDPAGITARIRERLPSGGYLHITNFLDDGDPRAPGIEKAFLEGGLGTGRFRTFAELRQYLDGLELVPPGLIRANDWRPDAETDTNSPVYDLYSAGMGRKP
ncbi:MAG TPA: SAM-dependent methyltransferase [Mycobacteriales bacterium]|nr:SAM-dependent methyltransferase [Mycobacteriales bacterium]